jgi:D-threo-aldose 1-dehydrogenase
MNAPLAARAIPRSDLFLSKLGVGTASLGNVFGPVDDAAAPELIGAAIDAGLRYFDTAPLYGRGLAESRLGSALQQVGKPDVIISTKVGRILDESEQGWHFDFSRDGILRSLDASLDRLRRNSVDILYLHDPDSHEDDVYHVAWPTLVGLKEQGVVRAIGVGMNQWQMPLRFVQRLDPDIVMVAGRYTLLDQGAALELLPACLEKGIGVALAGVFNSGILISPVDGAWYDYAPAEAETVNTARAIERVARSFGVSLAQLALQFCLSHPAATTAVVGVGSAGEIRANLAAAEEKLPIALLERLRSEGLVNIIGTQ